MPRGHQLVVLILAMCVAMFAHGVAIASSNSAALNVRTTIVKTCKISATAMNFGNIATVLGTETTTSTLAVICSKGTPYNVSLRANLTLTARNINLIGPGGSIIRSRLTLGATAGTTSGTHVLTGKLVARAYPPKGLYQSNQLIYVNY